MKNYDSYYYEDEQSTNTAPIVYTILVMSVVVLLVTFLMFWQNQSNTRTKSKSSSAASTMQAANEVDSLVSGSTLTSDELDIWNLPDTRKSESDTTADSSSGAVINMTTGEVVSGARKEEDGVTSVEEITGDTMSGSATENKSEEAELIDTDLDLNPNLALNDYDLEGFVYNKPIMTYNVDGEVVSTFGVDIAGKLGEVDFSRLKKAGCEFVMIRIGTRGYSSGNLVLDEKYKDNLDGAKKAKLDIGAYFTSQAVNEEEVLEETETLIDILDDYSITYPVVLELQATSDDVSRTEVLGVEERTELAKLFMDEIKAAGYTPMLSASEEWLSEMVDLEKLQDYGICLNQSGSAPDYPYQFDMWQYTQEGTIKGVDESTKFYIMF